MTFNGKFLPKTPYFVPKGLKNFHSIHTLCYFCMQKYVRKEERVNRMKLARTLNDSDYKEIEVLIEEFNSRGGMSTEEHHRRRTPTDSAWFFVDGDNSLALWWRSYATTDQNIWRPREFYTTFSGVRHIGDFKECLCGEWHNFLLLTCRGGV